MAFEYFDVPYRYNETCIKLLFQNPYTLFAFWDVSDEDEKKFIEKYGENSYYNSRIYLEVINQTNGKKFEIDVNPFAKTWYIHIDEPNCRYTVNLCRKINNETVNISSSNQLQVPTDAPHFPEDNYFTFINVQTNEVAFTLTQKQAINAINQVGTFSISEVADNDVDNIADSNKFKWEYLQNNPSSMENVGSGSRYMNKEECNE